MRLAVAVCTLLASLALAAPAWASPPVVYIENSSALVPAQAVTDALPAFQTMVSRDLRATWGVDATLTADPALAETADMVVYLYDDTTYPGVLGYHDVVAGRPVAYVFVRTCAGYREAWPLVLTHELEELLVDPWVQRAALWDGRWWLVEVADPVESGFYAYWIDGVPVSDFVTPAWYGGLPGPYDFTRKLRRPGQIGRHGFASYWDLGGWRQVWG